MLNEHLMLAASWSNFVQNCRESSLSQHTLNCIINLFYELQVMTMNILQMRMTKQNNTDVEAEFLT